MVEPLIDAFGRIDLSSPVFYSKYRIRCAPGGAGPGGIPTYNLGDPQYFMGGGGVDAYAARLAMEERREMLEDKRFDKYMRNMMMINMQKMMGAQTPIIGDPSGMAGGMGAIKEELCRGDCTCSPSGLT
jgi:hypothetical protein